MGKKETRDISRMIRLNRTEIEFSEDLRIKYGFSTFAELVRFLLKDYKIRSDENEILANISKYKSFIDFEKLFKSFKGKELEVLTYLVKNTEELQFKGKNRNISEDVDISIETVTNCLTRLEEKNLIKRIFEKTNFSSRVIIIHPIVFSMIQL